MRKIIILAIFILNSFTLFGQEPDSLFKTKIDNFKKEMDNRKKYLEPKEVENFSDYFKPKLISSFFSYIQKEKYDQLYENTDDQLKKIQSKEDLIKYFKAIKNIYGQLKSFDHDTYSIRNQMMSNNKTAFASYNVEFENVKANVFTGFNVIDSVTIKLMTFQISTDDYTYIKEFDKLVKSTFDYLKSKDYTKLYNSTSKRYQDYTPIAKFEEFTNQIDTLDLQEYKLFRNQIGVVQGKLLYLLIYEISNNNGYLKMTFTETEGKLLLEGLNYELKEE